MRVLDIISTANKNLNRSKLRTFLTLLAIAIGTFTLALSLGLGQGVKNYISSQLGTFESVNLFQVTKSNANNFSGGFGNGDPTEYTGQNTSAASFEQMLMNQQDIDKITATSGVASVILPYQPTFEYLVGADGKQYNAPAEMYYGQMPTSVIAGNHITNDSTGSILLSRKYISVLGINNANDAIGKTVQLTYNAADGQPQTKQFTVAGVFEPTIIDQPIKLSEADAKTIATVQAPIGKLQFYAVFVSKEAGVTDQQLKDNLAENQFDASSIADINNTLNGIVTGVQIALAAFSGVAILAALVGVINTLFMAVLERTKEIGLLRAIGSSKKTVFALFSVEAMLLGVWGSAIGLTSAYLAQIAINSIAENTFLKGIEGLQLLAITPWMALIIIATVATITLLAGILPAIKASRLDPIEALRYE